MSSDTPSDDTMLMLPQYLVMPETAPPPGEQGTNSKAQAEEMAHMLARNNTGKYVAVYQRVVLVRKST